MWHAKSYATATLWGLLALAGFALARLAPPLAGLTELGQSVLGAAFAGTVLWVSEVIPLGLTAIIVLVLLLAGLTGCASTSQESRDFWGTVLGVAAGMRGGGSSSPAVQAPQRCFTTYSGGNYRYSPPVATTRCY